VIASTEVPVPVAHSPSVTLLDASREDPGEAALREAARALSHGATFASRSYRYPYALVATHEAQVGCDIERDEPWDDASLESILTPQERTREPRLEPRSAPSIWSSKEALAKALGDALAYDPRRLEAPVLWPRHTSGRWRACSVDAPPGHVAWLCWRLP